MTDVQFSASSLYNIDKEIGEMEEAVKVYESLARPPKEALRTIEAGKLKGKTDINPQWRYKAMTEKFGLVGIGWKYEVQKLWTESGAGNEKLAFAQVAVFVKDGEAWSEPIVGIGGSRLVALEKGAAVSNDEGYKMAVTDAFSTALKMLGVAADIYAGLWDGSKYKDVPQGNAQMSAAPKKAQAVPTQEGAPSKYFVLEDTPSEAYLMLEHLLEEHGIDMQGEPYKLASGCLRNPESTDGDFTAMYKRCVTYLSKKGIKVE